MVQGDINADGIGDVPLINDVLYVPRDRTDISLDGNGIAAGVGTAAEQDSVYALIDELIRAEPCLRAQRGRILERNSRPQSVVWDRQRAPDKGRADTRWSITRAGGGRVQRAQSAELAVGTVARNDSRPVDPMTLRLSGYDATGSRGVCQYVFRGLRQVQDLASRWQVELSVRYVL